MANDDFIIYMILYQFEVLGIDMKLSTLKNFRYTKCYHRTGLEWFQFYSLTKGQADLVKLEYFEKIKHVKPRISRSKRIIEKNWMWWNLAYGLRDRDVFPNFIYFREAVKKRREKMAKRK